MDSDGRTLDKKLKKKKNGFIGETERYRVYLLYEADVEKLKKLAFTHDNAAEICKTDKSKKKKLVFAPVSHIEEKALRDVGIISANCLGRYTKGWRMELKGFQERTLDRGHPSPALIARDRKARYNNASVRQIFDKKSA